MCDGLCQPVYEEWVVDAVTLGRIVGFKGDVTDPLVRRALTRCNWSGSSAGSLDPQKEVAAAEAKVNAGFSTIERESAELNGSNWRDNIRQAGVERDQYEAADLTYPPDRASAKLGAGGKTFPTPSPEQGQPAARTRVPVTAVARRRAANNTHAMSGVIIR
jgi:capsid protein